MSPSSNKQGLKMLGPLCNAPINVNPVGGGGGCAGKGRGFDAWDYPRVRLLLSPCQAFDRAK